MYQRCNEVYEKDEGRELLFTCLLCVRVWKEDLYKLQFKRKNLKLSVKLYR